MTDAEVVERIYAAMAAKDYGALFALVDASIVITQDGRLPWGGRFEGHDGFATFGATISRHITSAVTIDAIFEADGDVLQVGRTKGTTVEGDRPFDIAEVHRWTIGPDGTATRAHFSIDTPTMLEVLAGER